jgi:hypothetical protein
MVTTRRPHVTEWATVTVHGSASDFAQDISVGRHRLAADEPLAVGGTPSPLTKVTTAVRLPTAALPLETGTLRICLVNESFGRPATVVVGVSSSLPIAGSSADACRNRIVMPVGPLYSSLVALDR